MVYYIETNLIAILIGAILLYQGRMLSSRHETSQIILNRMLYLLIILSVSDIAAYCFRGKSYFGVEISNTLYFIAMALGTYAWFLFIWVKLGYASKLRKTILRTCVPVVLLCAAILLNPLTNLFFSVDSNNLYHRGSGIVITWIVEWGYMLCAFAINIRAVLTEQRSFRRSELQGYLLFALPIAIAAACQMLFYGTTTTQIGYSVALLMAFLNLQHHQVQRDDLTGLNNKNAFLRYQDTFVNRASAVNLTLYMIDADKFKTINDVHGHLEGDQALKDIASVLKNAVGSFGQNRVLLYRYGGDEFIIVGTGIPAETIDQIPKLIDENMDKINEANRANGQKYNLSVSIGFASRTCADMNDFAELIKAADEDMYRTKQEKKNGKSLPSHSSVG